MSALALAVLLFTSAVPQGPPQIHLPRDPLPLDQRLKGDPLYVPTHPAGVCGTTRALAEVSRVRAGEKRPQKSLAANVFVQDNIVVMENDGVLMTNDRWPDLAGRTLTFTPAGSGFAVAEGPFSFLPPTNLLFQDQFPWTTGFQARSIALPFRFPFGGTSYTTAWVTNTMGIYFTAGAPPAPTATQLYESHNLFDRTPRVTPLVGGTSFYGYTAFLDEPVANQRVSISWMTPEVEIQVLLDRSGEITMSYNVLNVLHGTAAVITGNDSFWTSETEVASWTDAAGDVPIAAPDGLALDVQTVRVRQLPGTGVTHFVLELGGPPPASGGAVFYYELMFFPDTTSSTQAAYHYVQVRDGAVFDGSAYARVVGSTIEIGLPAWTFNLPGPGYDLRINTWWNPGGWVYGDYAGSPGSTLTPMGPSIMADWSADLPMSSDRPLYESFTLPSLNPYAVHDAWQQAFGPARVDGMSIYQNIYTEIIFWAGAYSTVGNAQADGIGVGSKADPQSPALLHMNALGYGWNANESARTCVLNQEYGHHYAYFARFKEGGVTSTNLNPDGAHPAGWVHTASLSDVFVTPDFSSFGGSFWTDNLDGTFTSSKNAWNGTSFWPVELYTMGLMGASEVPDWWYVGNANPPVARAYWAASNQTVSGTRVPATIQQIIDEEGPRDPAYPAAPTSFRVPFVLVVRPGTLTSAQSQETKLYCDEWERNFPTATLGRGRISCLASCAVPGSALGNDLKLVKGGLPGSVRYYWQNLATPPSDYVVVESAARDMTSPAQLGSGVDGNLGVELLPGASTPLYYRVAARNLPDCLGPL